MKGTGILGVCFPDVERRCLANSYGYIVIMLQASHLLLSWVAYGHGKLLPATTQMMPEKEREREIVYTSVIWLCHVMRLLFQQSNGRDMVM